MTVVEILGLIAKWGPIAYKALKEGRDLTDLEKAQVEADINNAGDRLRKAAGRA